MFGRACDLADTRVTTGAPPGAAVMQLSAFDYDLPAQLIAQRPVSTRSASRLLALDGARGTVVDYRFADLPQLLCAGDLFVFNNTRVIRARLHARKESGGRVELLIDRLLGGSRALAQARASKPLRTGMRLHVEEGVQVHVLGVRAGLYEVCFDTDEAVMNVLARSGHVPLPPYIRRAPLPADEERYQTVYAKVPGAVAAPTAGLHFDDEMLVQLAAAGVDTGFITLHIGAGTFKPVCSPDIRGHRMHAEHVEVGTDVCAQIERARARGARVVAVGTTVVRALETAAREGRLAPYRGETDLFIYPGYRFRVIDAMLTNFHMPRSSLLILICAFAGRRQVLSAYRHAVTRHYRFLSYGDATFILPQVQDAESKKQEM
jgi:S-adenosylmethionine:tRNA ribosyltransferase-isomerase